MSSFAQELTRPRRRISRFDQTRAVYTALDQTPATELLILACCCVFLTAFHPRNIIESIKYALILPDFIFYFRNQGHYGRKSDWATVRKSNAKHTNGNLFAQELPDRDEDFSKNHFDIQYSDPFSQTFSRLSKACTSTSSI